MKSRKAYYAKNRKKMLAYSTDYRFRRLYGLSSNDITSMAASQGGACLICRRPGKLDVDHDHASGKVRGLLCRNCNLALGHAKDDPALLKQMAKYLTGNLPTGHL